MNREAGFVALLGVVAVSIIFGMILGGRLNAPPVVHAAKGTAVPAAFPVAADTSTANVVLPDFSDIAEGATPAVVGVQNTSYQRADDDSAQEEEEEGPQLDDPLYRFFFPDPDERDRRAPRPSPRRVSAGSGFIITDDG